MSRYKSRCVSACHQAAMLPYRIATSTYPLPAGTKHRYVQCLRKHRLTFLRCRNFFFTLSTGTPTLVGRTTGYFMLHEAQRAERAVAPSFSPRPPTPFLFLVSLSFLSRSPLLSLCFSLPFNLNGTHGALSYGWISDCTSFSCPTASLSFRSTFSQIIIYGQAVYCHRAFLS